MWELVMKMLKLLFTITLSFGVALWVCLGLALVVKIIEIVCMKLFNDDERR